jgi:hypothetical protein
MVRVMVYLECNKMLFKLAISFLTLFGRAFFGGRRAPKFHKFQLDATNN